MDYKYILRDIKLSKLTGTPLSGEASRFIEFWDDLWADMKVKIDPIKGEIRCWKDDYDYYYFQQDDKNDNLWCDRYRVWSFFRDDFDLKYTETQELIQYMVDKTLNCEVSTPWRLYPIQRFKVDKTLNCKVGTPCKLLLSHITKVDCEVSTPINGLWQHLQKVDKTLNCGVSTPLCENLTKGTGVDKTLNCEVSTPQYFLRKSLCGVDKTLNCDVNNQ